MELPFKRFGIIPLKNMEWARTPDPKISFRVSRLLKPSLALSPGDVIATRVKVPEYLEKNLKVPEDAEGKILELALEQTPLVEGAILVLDQKTEDILAMVGGYDFARSQFNRAYQASRQTGSVFKPIVYLAALDKGFTPAALITDSPVVYAKEEAEEEPKPTKGEIKEKEETEEFLDHQWKPFNYNRRFSGDILFRNALIRSMNVPTVKVIEKIGIQTVVNYARRLGLFHPLNPDYTLALGSSSLSLYEMTKAFSQIGRLGKKIRPRILKQVLQGEEVLWGEESLDSRFPALQTLEQEMEKKRTRVFRT